MARRPKAQYSTNFCAASKFCSAQNGRPKAEYSSFLLGLPGWQESKAQSSSESVQREQIGRVSAVSWTFANKETKEFVSHVPGVASNIRAPKHNVRVQRPIPKHSSRQCPKAQYSRSNAFSKAQYSRSSKAQYSTRSTAWFRSLPKPQYSRKSLCFGFLCFGGDGIKALQKFLGSFAEAFRFTEAFQRIQKGAQMLSSSLSKGS